MNLKKLGMASIVVGVVVLVIGIFFMSMDTNPYMFRSSGMNDIASMFPIFMGVFGGMGIILGIAVLVLQKSIDSKPLERKRGKIIEKTQGNPFNNIIVEFDDGTRENLLAMGSVIISVGDTGVIGKKGKYITEFTK